jgi:hypothetical protein
MCKRLSLKWQNSGHELIKYAKHNKIQLRADKRERKAPRFFWSFSKDLKAK